MFTKNLLAFSLFLSLVMVSGPTQALPITWNVSNVTFDDGGIATGYIDFDYSSSTLLDWSISISGGNTSTYPAFTYDTSSSSSSLLNVGHSQDTFLFIQNSSSRQLRITPTLALDGSVSPVPLVLGAGVGTSGGEECFNCSPFRLITGGAFVAQVPEPASLILLGSGLLGLGLWGRKRVKARD